MRFIALFTLLAGLAMAVPGPQRFQGRKISGGRGQLLGSRRENLATTQTVKQTQSKSSRITATAKLPKCNENSCPPGYNGYNNKCYKVMKSDTPIDFSTAQSKCQTEQSNLASVTSVGIHDFLKELVRVHFTEPVDSQYKRAFVGLMCQDKCESPSSWIYADGTQCKGNNFCNWEAAGSSNPWNALPTGLYGPSIAAILDNATDTKYSHKIQPYPVDHTLQYMVCQKDADGTNHLKPRNLAVNERLSNAVLSWDKPQCEGDITSYIFVLLGGTASYDKAIKCNSNTCQFELNPEECNYCVHPNTDYTFSVAAVLADSKLGPAITVSKKIDVEVCPNFETPVHTISTCRGVSELVQDGSCEPKVNWSKGSMCDAVCETGYGFFNKPAPKYTCDQGGNWAPAGKAPECYEIVPVFSANLQFKIIYKKTDLEELRHQFDGLVYKYNDIFCPYPEECGIGDLQIQSALDAEGKKLSEVVLTIDTPVYNITDQAGFVDLVREAVFTVNNDNAFMTLIDYENIELVLPVITKDFKAEPQLCCHTCPANHAYKLGNCVRCPTPECA